MSSNEDAGASNNGDSFSDGGLDPNLAIAIAAMVISIVALIGTIMQVLQQYLASAAGYSNSGEKVIGLWSKSQYRNFLWSEMRFEVQFESPVIFLCEPTNTRGPVKGADVIHINGTDESYREARTRLPAEAAAAKESEGKRRDAVHTADNAQSTWVVLLQELQKMERESQNWQKGQYENNPPRSKMAEFSDHSLTVALQPMRRTWDSMPDGIKKPYATTTMCHLVELAAMLGIHWREFDRSNNKYRAEGNGYVLTGFDVDDLGVLFNFQIYGKSQFRENRVVPNDLVKELAFGVVPTIFKEVTDERRLQFATEEARDFSVLNLGSINEVAETFVSFGCNTGVSNILRSNTKRHGHLFPVAFEVLGMLGKTLHIRNSSYRVIPNPTVYRWDKKYFNMRKLLHEYNKRIVDDDLVTIRSPAIAELQRQSRKVSAKLKKREVDTVSLELLDTLHNALDKCDTLLRQFYKEYQPHNMVEIVLREHVQEVLRWINNENSPEHSDSASVSGRTGTGAASVSGEPIRTSSNLRFEDLDSASPEERQEKFMDIYFAVILPRVQAQSQRALHTFHRTRSSNLLATMSSHGRTGSESSTTSAATSRAPTPPPGEEAAGSSGLAGIEIKVEAALASNGEPGPKRPFLMGGSMPAEEEATNVWCTLVFRMLCWLLLHDMHKKDTQVSSKSELLGSRLPVFIA